MATANGNSKSFTLSGKSCSWYAICDYPATDGGTATVKIKVTTPSGLSGTMAAPSVKAYIDNVQVGSEYKNNSHPVPSTTTIGSKSVGVGSHTFKITFSGSYISGVNGDSSGSFTITSSATAPTYNSIDVIDVEDTTATLTASVSDGGATISGGGFQLSTDGGTNWTDIPGDYENLALTGLTPATTYTFRGYATNSKGTTYSSTGTFTTLYSPTVTSCTTQVTDTTAALTLTVGAFNNPNINTAAATVIIEQGGTTIYTDTVSVNESSSYTFNITGLSPTTSYDYSVELEPQDTVNSYHSGTITTTATPVGIPVSVNGSGFAVKNVYLSQNGSGFSQVDKSKIKVSVNGGGFQ